MRKHIATIVVAVFLLALVGHVVWQDVQSTRERARVEQSHLAAVAKGRAEALRLSPEKAV